MAFEDFVDFEVLYEPAYWIIVALAVVGLAVGFGGAGMFSSEQYNIPFYTKAILLVSVFPIAYIIVKIVSR